MLAVDLNKLQYQAYIGGDVCINPRSSFSNMMNSSFGPILGHMKTLMFFGNRVAGRKKSDCVWTSGRALGKI